MSHPDPLYDPTDFPQEKSKKVIEKKIFASGSPLLDSLNGNTNTEWNDFVAKRERDADNDKWRYDAD